MHVRNTQYSAILQVLLRGCKLEGVIGTARASIASSWLHASGLTTTRALPHNPCVKQLSGASKRSTPLTSWLPQHGLPSMSTAATWHAMCICQRQVQSSAPGHARGFFQHARTQLAAAPRAEPSQHARSDWDKSTSSLTNETASSDWGRVPAGAAKPVASSAPPQPQGLSSAGDGFLASRQGPAHDADLGSSPLTPHPSSHTSSDTAYASPAPRCAWLMFVTSAKFVPGFVAALLPGTPHHQPALSCNAACGHKQTRQHTVAPCVCALVRYVLVRCYAQLNTLWPPVLALQLPAGRRTRAVRA